MAKNVIIMIGDGMGWEMARAGAIASGAQFYTSGKGEGLNFQTLSNYTLATTYGTTIAPAGGRFSTGNSALDNSISATGDSPLLPGFTFNPTFNPGTTASGGATNTNPNAVGNLVGYDPERGGANPWTPGNDPEYGDAGNDNINAGDGDDIVFGNEGDNTLVGGAGDDLLYGASGRDRIYGGEGNNTIFGNEGTNTITAGNGNNTVYGGSGDDIFILGDGDNLIFANEGINNISTGSGNNTIYGGSKADYIFAGGGTNLIYANEGDNVVSAGIGNDTVYFGGGNEKLILNSGDGVATVFNYGSSDQISRGSTLAAGSLLSVSISGNDTLISAGSDLLATLKNVQFESVSIV